MTARLISSSAYGKLPSHAEYIRLGEENSALEYWLDEQYQNLLKRYSRTECHDYLYQLAPITQLRQLDEHQYEMIRVISSKDKAGRLYPFAYQIIFEYALDADIIYYLPLFLSGINHESKDLSHLPIKRLDQLDQITRSLSNFYLEEAWMMNPHFKNYAALLHQALTEQTMTSFPLFAPTKAVAIETSFWLHYKQKLPTNTIWQASTQDKVGAMVYDCGSDTSDIFQLISLSAYKVQSTASTQSLRSLFAEKITLLQLLNS